VSTPFYLIEGIDVRIMEDSSPFRHFRRTGEHPFLSYGAGYTEGGGSPRNLFFVDGISTAIISKCVPEGRLITTLSDIARHQTTEDVFRLLHPSALLGVTDYVNVNVNLKLSFYFRLVHPSARLGVADYGNIVARMGRGPRPTIPNLQKVLRIFKSRVHFSVL
jgi:hypothetical protein